MDAGQLMIRLPRFLTKDMLDGAVNGYKSVGRRAPLEDRLITALTWAQANRRKATHVGSPAIFTLHQDCQFLYEAFGDYGPYLVGSALVRPNWRDVDIRYILPDDEFFKLFPDATETAWEGDPRWIWMCTSFSARLSAHSDLPVDFQFQWQTHANKFHAGERDPLFIKVSRKKQDEADRARAEVADGQREA